MPNKKDLSSCHKNKNDISEHAKVFHSKYQLYNRHFIFMYYIEKMMKCFICQLQTGVVEYGRIFKNKFNCLYTIFIWFVR